MKRREFTAAAASALAGSLAGWPAPLWGARPRPSPSQLAFGCPHARHSLPSQKAPEVARRRSRAMAVSTPDEAFRRAWTLAR